MTNPTTTDRFIYLAYSPHLNYLKIGASQLPKRKVVAGLIGRYRTYIPEVRFHLFPVGPDRMIDRRRVSAERYVHELLGAYRINDPDRQQPGEHFKCSYQLGLAACLVTQQRFNRGSKNSSKITRIFEQLERTEGPRSRLRLTSHYPQATFIIHDRRSRGYGTKVSISFQHPRKYFLPLRNLHDPLQVST